MHECATQHTIFIQNITNKEKLHKYIIFILYMKFIYNIFVLYII